MTDRAREKLSRAKQTLREIRALDARIARADDRARPALLRERMRLVLRYIAQLGHVALLVLVPGGK